MNKQQHQQKELYLKQKQIFLQMELESKARELINLIGKYKIIEQTVLSELISELDNLQFRINSLIQQLKNNE